MLKSVEKSRPYKAKVVLLYYYDYIFYNYDFFLEGVELISELNFEFFFGKYPADFTNKTEPNLNQLNCSYLLKRWLFMLRKLLKMSELLLNVYCICIDVEKSFILTK